MTDTPSARVVIIDDEPEVCELIGKVLRREGYDAHSALNGEAGLALIAAEPPVCLVVDKLLPTLGGLEVAAQVRQRWPSVAIVLVTAHPEPFTLDTERPDAVLAKPFKNLDVVVSTVREAIEAVAAQRAARGGTLNSLKERVAAVVAEITPGRRKRE